MLTQIEITEVGLRDGLQREPTLVPTDRKLAWASQLAQAGLKRIQIASFVHPSRVPQMADAEAVCAGVQVNGKVVYSGLALNLKGLERATVAGLRAVDLSLSASDSHSRKNAGMSLQEARDQLRAMIARARSSGMEIRAGIQCAFGYFVPDVTLDLVRALACELLAQGIDSLALADSTGLANPSQVQAMLSEVLPLAEGKPVVLHLHDTRGMGLANVFAALQAGCRHFDTAFGGLGGCNFIPEAAGNVPTEDTVNMIHALGFVTGIDVAGVATVSREAEQFLGTLLPGKLHRSELFRQA